MFADEGVDKDHPAAAKGIPPGRGGRKEGPFPEIERSAARVNEPVMGAARVINRKLRIQYTGKPRVGSTNGFMELWKMHPDRPTDLTLMEIATSTPTPDTATTTYVFQYPAQTDPTRLKEAEAFAQKVIAQFEAVSQDMPVPMDVSDDYPLGVEVTPDNPDQLMTVMTAIRTFAEQHKTHRRINIRELIGRREVKEVAGKLVPYSDLRFVLGFPEELVRHAHTLPDHIRQAFAARKKAHPELQEDVQVTGPRSDEPPPEDAFAPSPNPFVVA